MTKAVVVVRTHYPDSSLIEVDWPDNLRIPMWGEIWDDEGGDIWLIDELAWDYQRDALGVRVVANLYLSYPDQEDDEDD